MTDIKNLMNNEELVRHITEDLDDIPEDTTVTYEVWAIGYDNDNEVTDTEMFIKDFEDPDAAIEHAKQLALADIVHQAAEEHTDTEPATDLAYIAIEVETVIEDEEGETMNIGTIYKRDLWIDGEYGSEEDFEDVDPIVKLSTSDFTLLEDGTLKVSCKLLKDFNKNDYIKVRFIDEEEIESFLYKIISKVIYEDGDYYHCEFYY